MCIVLQILIKQFRYYVVHISLDVKYKNKYCLFQDNFILDLYQSW